MRTNKHFKKLLFVALFFAGLLTTLVTNAQAELWGMTEYGGANDAGVLFVYNPANDSYTIKLDFEDENNDILGNYPKGSLMQASNGILYGLTNSGGANGSGVLFEYDPVGGTYTVKVNFDDGSSTGGYPSGNLVEASNGMLYGMTQQGGANTAGVLFEFNPTNGSFTNKLDFDNMVTGGFPFGSLVQASNGLLYGLTSSGGANYSGVLFEYNPATSTYTKKLDFDSPTTGGEAYGSLVQASNGLLYGMTSQGGVNSTGVIFEYNTTTSTYTKKYDFDYSATGGSPQGSLMQASNGMLYGMAQTGGANGSGVIFEFNPSGATYTKKFDFDYSTTGGNTNGSLMQASNGMLYGMTSYGGTNDFGAMFEFNPVNASFSKILDFDVTNGSSPNFTHLIEVMTSPTTTTAPVTTLPVLTEQCYNSTISVPVTVTDFNDIGGISLVLDYDETFLSLSGVAWNPAFSGGQYLTPVAGKITFSWIDLAGVTLTDGEALFTLDFDYIGANPCPLPATTLLTWDNSDPSYLEYSTPEGTALDDEPFGTYYFNGSIEIADNEDPVITTCPPTLDVEGCTTDDITNGGLTALAYSETSVTVTEAEFTTEGGAATDNCNGDLTYSYVDVSSGMYPIVVTRTWTVEDACGNPITCEQTINIDDTTPPTITCPTPDASYLVNDVCVWNASGLEFVAYGDVCGTPSLWYSIGGAAFVSCTDQGVNGLDFPIGDTEVTYKVIDAASNENTCSFTIHVDGITVSGSVNYNNAAQTSMDNDVTVILQQGGSDIKTTATVGGVYTFDDVCLGTYDVVLSTTKDNGGINSTDAAQVNFWSVNNSSIQAVRFYAGDVDASTSIIASDASQIQQYFLTLGNPSIPFATEWTFWNVDEFVSFNAEATGGYPQLVVTNAGPSITNDMYALVTGDFNRSFTPGAKAPENGNLLLTYGENVEVGAGSFDLPLYAGMNMNVGAVSIILDVPSDMLEVEDVYLGNDPNEQISYLVEGNELRISWFSMSSVQLQKGDALLTLKFNVVGNAGVEGTELGLIPNPLNELADDTYEVIGNAELVVNVIHTIMTGTVGYSSNVELLLSASPNPFKQSTKLIYTLPENGKVTLEVYNLLGNKVEEILDEMQDSGEHQLRYEANKLQPGVYTVLMRFEATDGVSTKIIKIISK